MRAAGLIITGLGVVIGCGDGGDGTGDAGITGDAPGVPVQPACEGAPQTMAPYPEPGAWPANRGPGGPAVTFAAEALGKNCAYLDGGEGDTTDHHNLVTMYDGYLLMPWAPESGKGGITLWDVSDPCSPQQVGYGFSPTMRETHSIGFSHHRGRWAVVNQIAAPREGGIQFWDLSDPTAPEAVADLPVDGFFYPDAYARVVLSVFWQAPWVYVAAADNGIYVVDATDPRAPRVAGHYPFEPTLRAGQVQAIGNLLVVSEAEGPRTALLDISDPMNPQPIGGGDFKIRDAEGDLREAYFSNVAGGYSFYARKDSGGGLIVYDIRDPSNPTYAGGHRSSDGNGGYVFVKDERAFVGESGFAAVYDIADLSNIRELARYDLDGDLDTVTPIGNVAVLSVDDDADDDRGTAIAPVDPEPDTRAPQVTWVWPPDGATDVPTTSRVGVTVSEFVDVASAWEGSVRLYRADRAPDEGRVHGIVSAQEVIVNFAPLCELEPDTEYVLEIPAGGLADFNGNAVTEPFTARFRTAAR